LIRSTILSKIQEIAAQQRKVLAPLDDQLDLDPFGAEGLNAFPVTLGEFIRLYENAAA
jgi:hypothetical protein